MIDNNRQSGRTISMLREVNKKIEKGKVTAVIAANEQQKNYIRKMYESLGYDSSKVSFYSPAEANSDRIRGLRYDDIFYDHYARECGVQHTLLDSSRRM